MNYGTIKDCDIANGIGVRISLFVSGCTHHCPGCFNAMTWDFSYGQPYDQRVEDKIIKLLDRSYIDGLSLLGGEPFEPSNQPDLLRLLKRVRKELPDKTVWIYSGYTFDKDMLEGKLSKLPSTREMLELTDILVDGEFVRELKNIRLRFRGSSNQRIIDVKASLEQGETVLAKQYYEKAWTDLRDLKKEGNL